MRIVFMGTPEFATHILQGLIENYDVVMVVTQPDKMVGRHQEIKFSKVKELALKNDIPVFQPEKIRLDYLPVLEQNPDIIVTCAYGQMIPKEILKFPKYQCVNVHASLLPKLRGGAPIHKAIMYGYEKTGITIMYMDQKMDSGDILSQEEIEIAFTDTAQTLHDKLAKIAKDLLLKTLPELFSERVIPVKQNLSEVTYAYNITREEEKIDWSKSSLEIYNQVRGLYSFPIAYTTMDDIIIKIHGVEICDREETENKYLPGEVVSAKDLLIKSGTGFIKITKLQLESKKPMTIKEFNNGYYEKIIRENKCFI